MIFTLKSGDKLKATIQYEKKITYYQNKHQTSLKFFDSLKRGAIDTKN